MGAVEGGSREEFFWSSGVIGMLCVTLSYGKRMGTVKRLMMRSRTQ